MTTYTIVAAGTDPLGPNEIAAGETITVADGDIFVIDPSANQNTTFISDGGTPADFDIVFDQSNSNTFNITVENDLSPTVDLADDVDVGDVKLDAKNADGLEFTAGDNVTFGELDGSTNGPNVISIDDGFSTDQAWKLGAAGDTLIVGDDATFQNIDTEGGDDTIVFGDRATINNLETREGDDSVTFGDDLNAEKVKTGDGDDTITSGENAQANEFDGGNDNDTHRTKTEGTNNKKMETVEVICFAKGMFIDTPAGPCAVETLRPSDLVLTRDRGPQPIRWIRSSEHALEGVAASAMPVLIQAGALGADRPAQDLIVSPQHRILVGGDGQLMQYFDAERLTPVKALVGLPGIRHIQGKREITWFHFACDRHEVVTANGCQTESLLLGPTAMNGLTSDERQSLTEIFGSARAAGEALNGPAARVCMKVGEVRRHFKNGW